MGNTKNLSLLKTTVSMWATLTKRTELLGDIQLENMEVEERIIFPPAGHIYIE
jgi:hypothetical protein